ncbi:uncharacterized protein LOC122966167 [Scomber scombrus]|uniref:Uncharacterized protein LOC122966167 n=1 Tax=Scomber scombrus TaxID=13677 RepID=A0AAV1NUZ2_SCOSC
MERKRTRLRLFSEEEEEDRDRISSQRIRKRIRRIEDDEEEEEGEGEEVQEEKEQPGPSTQNTYNKRTHKKRLLPVICGNKKGILDVERLERGEACIESEGHWFAPPAFESFGGKGSNKKWKISIFYKNKPLQFWFEKGFLTTKGYKRRGNGTAKHKNILSSDSESECPSEESQISLQSAEETEKDEDLDPGSEESAPESKDEEEEERISEEYGGEDLEEEDKMEKGEIEDEDISTDDSNKSDYSVFEVFLVKRVSENAGHTDVATSGHNAAQLQEMEQGKRCHQTNRVSDVLEGPASGSSADCNLNTMDIDQLKKEKIKMQLKVLKLKEEYYTLQINKCKQ